MNLFVCSGSDQYGVVGVVRMSKVVKSDLVTFLHHSGVEDSSK